MNRSLLDRLSGTHLTFIVVAALFAPSALYGVAAFTNVAIEDPVTGSRAGVTKSGELRTLALPSPGRASFFGQLNFFTSPMPVPIVSPPTAATLALNTLTISNFYDQINAAVLQATVSQSFTNNSSTCDANAGSKIIGVFDVAAGATIHVPYPNGGLMLQPPSSGYWCLVVRTTLKGNPASEYAASIAYSGYVFSGPFAQPSAAQASAPPTPEFRRR